MIDFQKNEEVRARFRASLVKQIPETDEREIEDIIESLLAPKRFSTPFGELWDIES